METKFLRKAKIWSTINLVVSILMLLGLIMSLAIGQFRLKEGWYKARMDKKWVKQLTPETENEKNMKKSILYYCWFIGGQQIEYRNLVLTIFTFMLFSFSSYRVIRSLLKELPVPK